MNTVTLTHELLLSVRTEKGGFTRKQIELLGLTWPPRQGWVVRLSGKRIPEETWQQVVEARTVFYKGHFYKRREPQQTPILPGLFS